MARGRSRTAAAAVLVAVLLPGLAGCERLREALDGIRRSGEERWEKSRRRLGTVAPDRSPRDGAMR